MIEFRGSRPVLLHCFRSGTVQQLDRGEIRGGVPDDRQVLPH
jgi:hypothetical protein